MFSEKDRFTVAPNTKKAISVLLDALADTLDYPEATLTAAAVVPLFTIILELAGKLEETMVVLRERITVCETAVSSSKELTSPVSSKLAGHQLMTDQNADLSMNYRVTFTVEVRNPELLLKKAREMDAKLTEIENEITAAARRRNLQEDYEPEGIDSIEEALCWVLPGGDDDAECIDILNAEAVAIGKVT